MKTIVKLILALALLLALGLQPSAFAQGTAFTYQGRLNDGNVPANGGYDLRFALFDAANSGTQQGITLTNTATGVTNGLFTVTLNFGNQFPGANRWLEIAVRTNGGGTFAALAPRQALAATPYAVQAGNANTASSAGTAGSVAAVNISGVLTAAQLPSSVLTNGASGVSISGSFIGNGTGLTNVPGTLPWQAVGGTNLAAVANQGYVLTNNSLTTVTLPASAYVGDLVTISAPGTNAWQIFAGYVRPVSAPWTAQNSAVPNLNRMASSADGTKLIAVGRPGQLSTSADGGVTWIPRSVGLPPVGSQWWGAVASSSDGTKLVAAIDGGSIYTSTNSGATWTEQTSGYPGAPYWGSVASSADGTKLVAEYSPGPIYTSTNSGVTWTARTNGIANGTNWAGVASSADGTMLVAEPGQGGPIYTSTNSGATWTAQNSPSYINWSGIASSADGKKLAALGNGYPVYTSSDSGVTWVAQNNSTNLYWRAIAMSADGSKLIACAFSIGPSPGLVSVSTDSGLTWTAQTNGLPNGGSTNWYVVASSADGSRLVAGAYSGAGQIFTSAGGPLYQSGVVGASTEFQYLGNGVWQPMGQSASAIVGTLSPASLPAGLLTNNQTGVNLSGTFAGNGAALTNVAGTLPAQNVNTGSVSAQPNRAYNATGASPVSVTLPVNAVIGDLVQVNGLGAGGWQLQATGGQIINGFAAGVTWTPSASTAIWGSLAVSANGSKGVAVAANDPIFTTADGGVTWTPQSYTNAWAGVASSADGAKCIAVAEDAQIYLSTNSGTTWNPTAFTDKWRAVASSDDGNKLVAMPLKKSTGAPLYTSTDGGATWTLRPFTNEWISVASSANGSRLIAGTHNQRVFLSKDGGTNWAPTLYTNGNWSAVASSADGNKLVAAAELDAIYTSADGGTNWTGRPYTNDWSSVASSADGTTLVAGAFGDRLYISRDSGMTWTAHGPVAQWIAVACSADGSRFFAADYGGQLYISSALPLAGAQGNSMSLRYAGNGVWQPTDLMASSTNSPNTTVARDLNGNFSAGTITADSFLGSGTGLTGVALLSGGNTFSGDQALSGQSILELGAGVQDKEPNAGKLGYQVFSDALDILGAGTNAPNRKIQFWAEGGSTFTGPVSATGFNGDGTGLTNLVASQLSSGTVPVSLLSSNVALRSSGNTFSGDQIVSSGKVGIGTASPPYPLTFSQSLGDKIALFPSGGNTSFGFGIQSFQMQIHVDTPAADIVFGSGQSSNLTETMRIKGSGNVGIGTNNPTARLQVTGSGIVNVFAGNRSPFGVAAFETDFTAPQTHIWCAETGTNVFNVTPGGAGFFAGSVGIGISAPTNKLHVIGGATFSSGAGGTNQNVVWVPGSASWSFTSDRNTKDRMEPVDQAEVLAKVCDLNIAEWNYIGYQQRHIGPMAQDFHAQFPLNGDDKSLNDADLHGVALAAIQGLNQKVESGKQKAEIRIQKLEAENADLRHGFQQKETEITGLRQRLEKLEQLLDQRVERGSNR